MSYFIVLSLFVFICPVFSITALNTLFGLGIPLTVGTWFAMFWLHLMMASSSTKRSFGKQLTK